MKYVKTIECGLYFLAFLLPLQTRLILGPGGLNGGYFEYGTYSLYLTDIFLMAVLLLFIISKLKSKRIFNFQFSIFKQFLISNFQFLFIFFFLSFSFISIFFAQDKFLAAFIYVRLLLGIGLFWILFKADFKFFKLIYFFLAGIFLQSSLAVWQFFAQSSFASKWLGMAAHNPADLGVSVIETFSGERWLRAYGGLDHPNILGGVMALGLLILFVLLLKLPRNKKQETNKFQISNFKFQKILNYTLHPTPYTLVFFSALFFSFSRNAWLGFFLGWLILFALAVFRKINRREFLKASASLGILALLLFYFYGGLVKIRVYQESRLENKSIAERLDDYEIAKDILKKNWLFGVGMGNYGLAVHKLMDSRPSYFYQPAHNSFILVWAEIGIFGLLGFLLFIAALFFRKIKEHEFLLALLAPLFFMLLFEHWFWSLHFGVLFFWFFLGLAARSTYAIIQED